MPAGEYGAGALVATADVRQVAPVPDVNCRWLGRWVRGGLVDAVGRKPYRPEGDQNVTDGTNLSRFDGIGNRRAAAHEGDHVTQILVAHVLIRRRGHDHELAAIRPHTVTDRPLEVGVAVSSADAAR